MFEVCVCGFRKLYFGMWIWCLVQTHVYTGKQSRATASEKWLQSLFLQQSLLKKSRVTN